MAAMPPPKEPKRQKSLQQLIDEVGIYPPAAYQFIQEGLGYTVQQIHGRQVKADASRHVSGPQLCEGLRQFALDRWGLLARTVLRRWNITSTLDFGRIVFALIQIGHMQKTSDDSLEDFENVYDFKTAFDSDYRIKSPA